MFPELKSQWLYVFYFIRKWSQGKRKGAYQGPVECLPELMAACDGKEDIFASIMDCDLTSAHITQVTIV